MTDGGIRDLESLQKLNIGVFASQETNMTMPSHILPSDYQVNIQCGGVLVMPGDYLTADDGGVVVIPKDLVGEVVKQAQRHELMEAAIKHQLETENVQRLVEVALTLGSANQHFYIILFYSLFLQLIL